ncbi:hypothetical protein F0U60_15010 [Archangium minus]|uniref:Uncharacterized protein n=1 Tax=Archangium minus TaxID=83450 RepID=A0ABY9WN87_9BACT|nr:hypothetical protein F0U60_15010 [Archangium minus]
MYSHIEVTDDAQDKFIRGTGAWLIRRSGHASEVERAAKLGAYGSAGIELDPGEFRGMTLADLARECLERRGVDARRMQRSELFSRALNLRTGYQTSSDFALVLENALHKLLLGAYALTADTWKRFCRQGTVKDFRASGRYRTGSFGVLDDVGESGEIKNKAIPDGEKVEISIGTKGNIISISRVALINDDMGVFQDLATKFGRAAALTIEEHVYRELRKNSGLGPTQPDGNPFFHASRSNINATSSGLSVAGINADRVVMAQQKDPSGNEFIDLRPAVLVIPIGLGGDARVINDAQYDTTANTFQKPNSVRGLFRDIVDTPRLEGTRRYLFADPNIAAAIEVAFLEESGSEPRLDMRKGFEVDGISWRVVLDYGVAFIDHRAAVTNAGA